MKSIFLLFAVSMKLVAVAQNVGIGTSAPTKRLHVVGTTRTDTLSIGTSAQRAPLNFVAQLGDKISFWDDGTQTGPHYGIGLQSGLLQIHSYSSVDDIAFGYGASENFTERMRIKGNGNLGINTGNPQAYGHGGNNTILELRNPGAAGANMQSQIILSSQTNSGSLGGLTWVSTGLAGEKRTAFIGSFFESATAARIGFFTRNTNGSFNEKMSLGSEGGLRVEGPAAVAKGDALSIGGFGEVEVDAPGNAGGRFTIKENGNVGINKNNPGAKLDINGDLNINAALRINGNGGLAGQVLTSNGNAAAPFWGSATNQLFNNTYTFNQIGGLTVTGNSESFDLPGLTQTITLQQTSKVLVSMHMQGYNAVCLYCGNGVVNFFLIVDNVTILYKKTFDNGDGINEDSGLRMITLGAGLHTFKMKAVHISGADVNILPNNSLPGTSMIVMAIPQ